MRTVMVRTLAVAALVAASSVAGAQGPVRFVQLELRPFAGAFLPTGAMRDEFKAATTLGLQGGLELTPRWHLVGTLGWTRGHNRFAFASDRTDIWHYDGGLEFGPFAALGTPAWRIRPFVGTGAGARTHDYRTPGVATRTCSAGYFTGGSELQHDAIALRLEARGYLSCFTSPITERQRTRSDAQLTLGVAYHIR